MSAMPVSDESPLANLYADRSLRCVEKTVPGGDWSFAVFLLLMVIIFLLAGGS